jgi:hypothetical protein
MTCGHSLYGQPVECSAAWPLHQDLQADGPQPGEPGVGAGKAWPHRVLEQLPGAPPRGRARPIPAAPSVAHRPPQAFIEPQGIEPLAMEPTIRQRASVADPQQVRVQQTFPPLHGDLDLPAGPVHRQGCWPGEQGGGQRGQHQGPTSQPQRAFLGLVPFLAMALHSCRARLASSGGKR